MKLLVALLAVCALALPAATAADVPAPIGLIGMSNARMAVQGYQALGGTRFWNVDNLYSSGTVYDWWFPYGTANKTWNQFRNRMAAYPGTSSFLWVVGDYCTESDADINYAADHILAYLRTYVNQATGHDPTVYVSTINGYVAPHYGASLGPNFTDRAKTLQAHLIATYGLQPGPDLGTLHSKFVTADRCTGAPDPASTPALPNETLPDGIHPNAAGQAIMGAALLSFFGK